MLSFSPVHSADFTAFKYCFETQEKCSVAANRDVCCRLCEGKHLKDTDEQDKIEAHKQCMGM